jgi:hypothetical protein
MDDHSQPDLDDSRLLFLAVVIDERSPDMLPERPPTRSLRQTFQRSYVRALGTLLAGTTVMAGSGLMVIAFDSSGKPQVDHGHISARVSAPSLVRQRHGSDARRHPAADPHTLSGHPSGPIDRTPKPPEKSGGPHAGRGQTNRDPHHAGGQIPAIQRNLDRRSRTYCQAHVSPTPSPTPTPTPTPTSTTGISSNGQALDASCHESARPSKPQSPSTSPPPTPSPSTSPSLVLNNIDVVSGVPSFAPHRDRFHEGRQARSQRTHFM